MCSIAWHIWIKGTMPILPYTAATIQARSTLMARRHPNQSLTHPPPYSRCGLPLPTSSVSHFLLGQLGWSLVSMPLPAQMCREGSRCQVTQTYKLHLPRRTLSMEP